MQHLKQEGHDAFIEAGGLFVHVLRTDEGVIIAIWPTDDEEYILDNDPIASTWAFFSEALGD